MANSKQLKLDQIQFEAPIRKEIFSNGNSYYFQDMKYQGEAFHFYSPWFVSEGLKKSIDNKPELLFKLDDDLKSILHIIEEEAIRQLKFPSEYGIEPSYNRNFFKCLPTTHLYAKLSPFATVFDEKRNQIDRSSLKFGEYRIVGHVKGIYIGKHGQSKKYASLQIKVFQIQYKAIEVKCLFDDENSLPLPKNISCDSIPMAMDGQNTVKRAPKRKTKRQQQMDYEAMAKAQEMLDSLPDNLFDDVLNN